ncbi:MAG: DUF3500 domain-containing protein [Chloroflexi bacterium]|nr:DUF3500 domain-containing protein [Chloroflexota bacterium]
MQQSVGVEIRSPAAAADTPVKLESETARRMAEAATTFVAALTPAQRAKTLFAVDDEERQNWHYIPRARQGLSFKEMDASQMQLAHALISSGLSRRGYAKAVTIMSLEKVLGELEGTGRRLVRDPELYYVTIFGTPGDSAPWGWRVEGHHVSLNFLVVEGERIAPAPNFYGANPARVPQGDLAGLRVLAAEEDLARRLLKALDPQQRHRVLLSPDAPSDILTRAERHAKVDSPAGLAAAGMRDEQRRLLWHLVQEYVTRMPEDVADTRLNRIEKEGTAHIHFAWAGAPQPGGPHYYRLQGPSFLVEYDNTQNDANHIHTVWRDLTGDWGEDLLAGHYERSHH